MIKNNIFIPILTIALISSGLGMSTAYAADDPDPCSGEGWDTAVTLAVGGVLADSIESGDTVDVIVNINNDKNPDNHCNINGAEVGVYTPDLTGNHGDLPDALDITLCDPTDAGAAEPPFCMWQANRDDSPGPEQPATFVCYVPDDTDNTTIALACDQQAIDDGNVFQNTALTVTVTVNEGVEEAGFRSCGTGDNPVQDGANGDDLDKCGDANVDIHYPYDIETESDPKGLITDEMDLPVTSVTDTITILGVDTIEGTFDVTKADLVNDDTGVTVGSLGVDVTCDAALTTDMFDAMTTLVCTWTGSALDPATYCWDVTVDDTSDTYVPTEVSHNGCENTGTDPQDDTDEQFTVPNPFDFETLSNPMGLITDEMDLPVTSATDTITIDGVNGELGTFQGSAELILIGDGPVAGTVVCLPDTHDIDMFTDNTMVCTWSNGGTELLPGEYCWDVTVVDTSGNYVPDTVRHDGCPRDEDNPYEQFVVPPQYDFETDSDPNGLVDQADLPVTMASDTITILGVDGFEGTFDVTKADLVNDDTGATVGSLGGDVTCDSALTTDMFDAMTTLECTWTGVALETGNYCWDVTVDDTSNTYLPTEVSHNACATTGDNPEDDSREQFMIAGFEGCTPGYWKQSQHFGSYPDGVFPDDTLAFHGFVPDNGISDTTTLLEALKFGGGKGELGAEKILLRAAVAGFLNEGSLNYGLIDVVGQANTAMDSNDRQTMLTLAGTIDDANNAEDDEGNHLCPFGNDPGPSSSP